MAATGDTRRGRRLLPDREPPSRRCRAAGRSKPVSLSVVRPGAAFNYLQGCLCRRAEVSRRRLAQVGGAPLSGLCTPCRPSPALLIFQRASFIRLSRAAEDATPRLLGPTPLRCSLLPGALYPAPRASFVCLVFFFLRALFSSQRARSFPRFCAGPASAPVAAFLLSSGHLFHVILVTVARGACRSGSTCPPFFFNDSLRSQANDTSAKALLPSPSTAASLLGAAWRRFRWLDSTRSFLRPSYHQCSSRRCASSKQPNWFRFLAAAVPGGGEASAPP